jgi:RNA polymerase sigma-70 factor (ECF subfamily)
VSFQSPGGREKLNRLRSESRSQGTGVPSQPEEFREVFDEFYPRLRSFFRSYGFASADAEDLSQNTLWNVYRTREQYRGDGTLHGWIYAAARNAARDEWRRRGRRGKGQAIAEETPDPAPPADVVASDREQLNRTLEALRNMPSRMRACLLLRVQSHLSYREIARRFSLSVHTVKVQIWNARRRLRQTRVATS